MASFVDSISSPRSSQELPNAPSPIVPLLHGDDALSSSALAPPIGLPVIPGRSPRKPFVETQPPRSTFGSEHGASCNAADVSAIPRVKKPAWNVPSNSVNEPGSVMDTISWPALSESARASPKSSSYDSLRALSEGSISALPISSVPSPSSKHALNNQNLNSAQNSASPRGKITKDGTVTGGGSSISGASSDTLTVPSSLPALTETSQLVPGKQSSPENSPQGLPNQNNNNTDYDRDNNSKAGGFSSHSHGGNDHHRGYGGGRRGGNGHHGNYGNRRNTERGGYEWSPRNFARGFHMQQLHQQRGVGPYLRSPSATSAPFITPPPPPRPFPNHLGFPDFQSPIYYVAAPQHPESLRGIPFASHPAPTQQVMLLPAADPQCAMLLKQIDYYFSPENLCKDLYLRQNMDEQGWVPISLIAGFNRVRQLTNSIQYIIDTVQLSSVVEVQGDKIRKRNDWMAWVLHPVDSMAPATGMQFPGANFDGLAARFDNIYLDLDAPNSAELDKSEAAFARSSSAKLNGMRNSEGGDAAQASSYSDRIWNMRTLLRSDTM